MKILVVSDTHGNAESLKDAVLQQSSAEMIIHLGDGKDDLDKVKEYTRGKEIYKVCGNCDINDGMPHEIEIMAGKKKILAVHGNTFKVKKKLDKLIAEAKSRQANIVLYGHTHTPKAEVVDKISVMNPGSLLAGKQSYGVIDIDGDSVDMRIFEI